MKIAAKINSCSTLCRRLPSMVKSNLLAMTTLIWHRKLVGTLNQDTAGVLGHVCNSNTQGGQRQDKQTVQSHSVLYSESQASLNYSGTVSKSILKINKWIKIRQEYFNFKHPIFMSGWEVDNNCGSPIWIMKAIYFWEKSLPHNTNIPSYYPVLNDFVFVAL